SDVASRYGLQRLLELARERLKEAQSRAFRRDCRMFQPQRRTFSASESHVVAEPGVSGFGWLSCGAQPESHRMSKVARSRPSGSENRSAYAAAARKRISRRSGFLLR